MLRTAERRKSSRRMSPSYLSSSSPLLPLCLRRSGPGPTRRVSADVQLFLGSRNVRTILASKHEVVRVFSRRTREHLNQKFRPSSVLFSRFSSRFVVPCRSSIQRSKKSTWPTRRNRCGCTTAEAERVSARDQAAEREGSFALAASAAAYSASVTKPARGADSFSFAGKTGTYASNGFPSSTVTLAA